MKRKNFYCIVSYDDVRTNFIHIDATAKAGDIIPSESTYHQNFGFTLMWDEIDDDGTEGRCRVMLNTAEQLKEYISNYQKFYKDDDAKALITWMKAVLRKIKRLTPHDED